MAQSKSTTNNTPTAKTDEVKSQAPANTNIEEMHVANTSSAVDASAALPLADRLPKKITPGQTLYVRPIKDAALRADKVKAIVIRETNVGILFYSDVEINASEIGSLILFKDTERK